MIGLRIVESWNITEVNFELQFGRNEFLNFMCVAAQFQTFVAKVGARLQLSFMLVKFGSFSISKGFRLTARTFE